MSNLPGLHKGLYGNNADFFSGSQSGSLKRRIAATSPGGQLRFKRRQSRPVKHRGEGLGKTGSRSDGYSAARYKCVIKEERHQRGRQQRQIDGKKYSPVGGGGSQCGADSPQGATAWHAILHHGREPGKG